MENKKVNFFSRVKIAVTKLENYGMFLEEKLSVAIKYFLLIVLILTISVCFVQTLETMNAVTKGYQYIKNELPDFSYQDGKLEFTQEAYGYDEEYDFYLIGDTTNEISNEKIDEYKNKIGTAGLIFLNDKVICKVGGEVIEYKYTDIVLQYGINSINNKASLTEKIDSLGIYGIGITIFLTFVLVLYFAYIVSVLMDWILMSVFAYLVAKICKINMTYKNTFNISIYALTLPIILNILYNIAFYFAGFYTEYFRTVYMLISYVYIVAVIMMIKSDLVKQQIELTKIQEVQKKVHEELEEQKEEDKKEEKKPEEEKKKKDETEDDIAGEPDGSEI